MRTQDSNIINIKVEEKIQNKTQIFTIFCSKVYPRGCQMLDLVDYFKFVLRWRTVGEVETTSPGNHVVTVVVTLDSSNYDKLTDAIYECVGDSLNSFIVSYFSGDVATLPIKALK